MYWMRYSYDKGKFKWMPIKDLKMNLTVKDKSKAKWGVAILFMDKLCLIQSRGVEVQDANQIWEYSLRMIIALSPNLQL